MHFELEDELRAGHILMRNVVGAGPVDSVPRRLPTQFIVEEAIREEGLPMNTGINVPSTVVEEPPTVLMTCDGLWGRLSVSKRRSDSICSKLEPRPHLDARLHHGENRNNTHIVGGRKS